MCGLAGYSLRRGVKPRPDFLLNARSTLAHRGPDGSGVFENCSQGIGLVHTRLSILDTSPQGHQPMISHDGSVALVFNGEIYNFRALRAQLEEQGHIFCSDSDTEVLLTLYVAEKNRISGQPCIQSITSLLRSINGIFSFALWDADYQSLLIARDAFGVKPMYFEYTSEGIYFASELKALSHSSLHLDVVSLDRYLTFLWSPGDGTPAAEIHKLSPGQAMWIENGEIREHFPWYLLPAFEQQVTSNSLNTLPDVISGVQSRLRQAVHRQMISDVPLGSFLSGGLDSSSIVTFARELNPELRCFTIQAGHTSDGEGYSDDLPYARRVASHLGVQLDVVQVDASKMAAGLEDMVWQLDEPLADPAPLNVLYISQLARQQGIKVLLSGAGGDDLFSGYSRHLALRAERFWSWLPRFARIHLRELTGQLTVSQSFSRRLRKAFSGAHLQGDERLVHYFRWIDRSDLFALYTPAFRSALGQSQAEEPMLAFLATLPKRTTSMERMLNLEQRFFLVDHNLTYTDRMSMLAGVEVRVPFLDPDLVEFSARVPSQYKQRRREGKWILKKAMEPFLPHDVIYRRKSGFGAPLRTWLRTELRDWLADTLSVERLHSRGLFDPQAVHRLMASNLEGTIDASYTLLSLACIEIWCRHFIDYPVHNPSSISYL
ncbi:asparagine synthase (glutamine-hydrolyzing) [bacterium]|nr:asparagine synthase (glutamine-hydrolyzing) [bacterium]